MAAIEGGMASSGKAVGAMLLSGLFDLHSLHTVAIEPLKHLFALGLDHLIANIQALQ